MFIKTKTVMGFFNEDDDFNENGNGNYYLRNRIYQNELGQTHGLP